MVQILEIRWVGPLAPSEVILHRGALIECVDLVKASHLNGKRGWIYDYDEATERHVIHFEDEDTKECLVKPGNLRLCSLVRIMELLMNPQKQRITMEMIHSKQLTVAVVETMILIMQTCQIFYVRRLDMGV